MLLIQSKYSGSKQGGTIAGNTRKEIEEKTGKPVVSKLTAKQLRQNKQSELEKDA